MNKEGLVKDTVQFEKNNFDENTAGYLFSTACNEGTVVLQKFCTGYLQFSLFHAVNTKKFKKHECFLNVQPSIMNTKLKLNNKFGPMCERQIRPTQRASPAQ